VVIIPKVLEMACPADYITCGKRIILKRFRQQVVKKPHFLIYFLLTFVKVSSNSVFHCRTYLQSNENLPINDGFRIDLKVIEKPHHQTGWAPHKPIKGRHSTVRKSDGLKLLPISPHPFITEVPIGYPKNVRAFANKCVLMSTMIGYYMVKQHENPQGMPRKVRDNIQAVNNYYLPPSRESIALLNKAGEQMLLEVLAVETKFPFIIGKTSHKEICPLLARHYSCQINVIDSDNPKEILKMYPPALDQSLPQVNLFVQRQKGDVDHMMIIKSLNAFQRFFGGKQCQACRRVHAGPTKHFCRSRLRRTCKFCLRPFQQQNTYINKKNENNICLRGGDNANMTACDTCNVSPASVLCQKKHTCRGYYCKKCRVFTHKCGRLNVEKCKKKHKCNKKICTFCSQSYAQRTIHYCELARPDYLKKIPNVGFLSIEQYDNRECNCDQCSEGLLCEDHLTQHDLFPPIMVTLLAEHGQRGQFKQFRWYSDELKCVDDVPEDNHFKYEFSQKNCYLQDSPLTFEPRIGNFGPPESKKNPSLLPFLTRDIKTLNATEKVLYTLLSNSQFENMSILTLGHHPLVNYLLLLKALS
jgi:hypothetical protein